MKDKEKCPVCGSEEYASIDISGGGEYPPGFCTYRAGSIDVICCTDCGVLRVTQDSLKFRKLKEK